MNAASTRGILVCAHTEQLMLAFVMLMGDTPLVGTHSLQHMMEDMQISRQYRELFTTDSKRAEYARSIGIKS